MEWKRKPGTWQMTEHTKKGVCYVSFPLLDAERGFVHGFSTRIGGVSEGDLSSMNLSFTRGDDPERVRENYRRIAAAVGFETDRLVLTHQTHTNHVRVVTEADAGKGFVRERDYTDVDGLVTDVPQLVLTTFYADCVPLFFSDPENKAVGLSHSGWRGTVGKIGKVTVEKMAEEFGTDPSQLYAAIGPSICQECYEVSEDVIEQFKEAFDEKYWDVLFYGKPDGKYQLNLWEANRRILLDAGIKEERISMPGICTCCNPLFLYSHRASHGKRGNLGAFITFR